MYHVNYNSKQTVTSWYDKFLNICFNIIFGYKSHEIGGFDHVVEIDESFFS